MAINGTSGNDVLTGTFSADQIFGLDGADFLDGKAGSDSLVGGSGDDTLSGSFGDDTLLGGDGNDNFFDLHLDSFGDDSLVGGPGNDSFLDTWGNNVFDGGPGDDVFFVYVFDGGSNVVTGGGEDDTYQLISIAQVSLSYVVTDFEVGFGGDLIDVDNLLSISSAGGYYTGGNPFDSGFLQLVQPGANTLVQWDRDGEAGSTYGWLTQITLASVTMESVSSANFVGGIPPNGALITGQTINGTNLDDALAGALGNDSIYGFDGADFLDGRHGNDTLDGGAGNDTLRDTFGTNFLYGGTGDDLFLVYTIDGGTNFATGSSGADTYRFVSVTSADQNYVVTDFDIFNGDLLDVDGLLAISGSGGFYSGGNPFASGFLRLVQSDVDTLLQWDRDGAAGSTYGWATQITLWDVDAADLTSDYFVGGIPPDGSSVPGFLLIGDTDANTLVGSIGNDTLRGFEGSDFLDGKAGNDSLSGGEQNDTLSGSFGNDTALGGDGDDEFFEANLDSFGNDSLVGGNGNDSFLDNYGSNVLDGGAGDDVFYVQVLDTGSSTVTGGSGRDSYLLSAGASNQDYRITDFAVGANGDLIEVDGLLSLSGIGGFYTGGNASALGFVRLLQSGADTLLQWDRDGAAVGAHGWVTQITLQNVAATSVTSDNFVGQLIIGTPANDTLIGGLGNDTIRGLGGDDLLDGSLGADNMEGGSGNDLYYVDNAGDIVTEVPNIPSGLFATIAADIGTAIDGVISSVGYALGSYVENLTLQSSAGAASGTGNELPNALTGNESDNTLSGLAGNDTLTGGPGNDLLHGGDGIDKAVYTGARSAYSVTRNGLAATVSGAEGTDALASIEWLQFSDGVLRLAGTSLVDFDASGKSDFVLRNANGTIEYRLMNGVSFAGFKDDPIPTYWSVLSTNSDFNGDGKSDVVLRHDNGTIEYRLVDGVNMIGFKDDPIPTYWSVVSTDSDLNGDGKSDVILRHDNGTIEYRLMDGVNMIGFKDDPIPTYWSVVSTDSDFNGDGKSDLAIRHDNGTIEYRLMDGVNMIGFADDPIPGYWHLQ